MSEIIRWTLTMVLIGLVYPETGFWTTLAIALLSIANELRSA